MKEYETPEAVIVSFANDYVTVDKGGGPHYSGPKPWPEHGGKNDKLT